MDCAHQNGEGIAKNGNCGEQNENGEKESANWVGEGKTSEFNDNCGDENTNGLAQVAKDVDEGGTDVQILVIHGRGRLNE